MSSIIATITDQHCKSIIVFVCILTALFSFSIRNNLFDDKHRLVIDNSLEPFFSRDSGAYDFYKDTNREFGSDQILIVALQPIKPDRFDLAFFLTVHHLEKQILDSFPEVEKVISITNTPQVEGACIGKSYFHRERIGSICVNILEEYEQIVECIRDGVDHPVSTVHSEPDLAESLEIGPDNPMIPPSEPLLDRATVCSVRTTQTSEQHLREGYEGKVAEIVENLKEAPLINKDLMAAGKNTVAVIIKFRPDTHPSSEIVIKGISSQLETIAKQGIRVAFGGQPRDEYEYSRVLRSDIRRILPLGTGIILMVFLLCFQSIRGMLIPFVVVITGLIWTVGIFSLLKKTPNLVTLVLPTLLFAVGSAYVIHFMTQYYQSVSQGESDRRLIMDQTLSRTALPIGMTVLTTIIGFLALTTSPIPAVREMGIFSCLGLAIITFLTLVLAPAILSLLPNPRQGSRALKAGFIDLLMTKLGHLVSRYSKRMILLWLIIGLAAFLGGFQIKIDSSMRNFASHSSITRDKQFIEEQLAGTSYLRIVLQSPKDPARLKTAEAMLGILKFKQWLLSTDQFHQTLEGIRVDKIYTPLEHIEIDRQGLDSLTDSEVNNFFKRRQKRDIPHFLNSDHTRLSLTVRMMVSSTADFLVLRDRIDEQLREYLPFLTARYTGSAILASESARNITESQILSLTMALLLIFVVLSLLFFSVKMGILAVYPNAISILIFFGALGWLSIPIGVTISLIASIALGIGVDDTIHFITHYNTHLKELKNEREAARKSLRQIGKPMVYTTLALTLGFSVFVISDMRSQVLFGIMTAFTLMVCLFSDINLLPAILIRTKLITAWDYLQIQYTQDFLEEIDLFKGLGVRESKLATLVTDTRDIEEGEVIFVENEPVQDLFVILKGEVSIYIEQKYHRVKRELAVLKKGNVFGAQALFPQTKRMTSAKANNETCLLVLNQQNLLQLKKRYPGIAAKIFINLARSLENSIKRRYYKEVGFQKTELDFEQSLSEKVGLTSMLDKIMTGVTRSEIPEGDLNDFEQFKKQWTSKDSSSLISPEDSGEQYPELTELADQIISSGTITYHQKILLQGYMHFARSIYPELEDRLEKLKWLIQEGKVLELKPRFADIFNSMTPRDIHWIKKNYEIKRIPNGTRIFTQGDFGDYMMIVMSGRFNTSIEVDGNVIQIATLIPGDLVGEMSVISDDYTQPVTAKAMEDSDVVFISQQGFKKMLKSNSKLAALFSYNLVGMLSHRLRLSTMKLYG